MKNFNKLISYLAFFSIVSMTVSCQENQTDGNSDLTSIKVTPSETGPMVSPKIPDQFADMAIAAENGNVRAQFNMGVLFDMGEFVPENDAVALSWYEKAVSQGFAPAQMSAAELYDNGLGVAEDNKKAEQYYILAAEQGILEAQMRLGAHYQSQGDFGLQEDKSAKWFLAAAEQGHPPAMTRIGAKYADGKGVRRDFKTAYMWTYLASQRQQTEADVNLARIATRLSENDIAEAIERARACQQKSFKECSKLI